MSHAKDIEFLLEKEEAFTQTGFFTEIIKKLTILKLELRIKFNMVTHLTNNWTAKYCDVELIKAYYYYVAVLLYCSFLATVDI